MCVIIQKYNRRCTIDGADSDTIKELSKKLSFKSAGREYAESFQTGTWDGRVRLMKYNRKFGYHCPGGLLDIIESKLVQLGVEYKIIDHRAYNNESVEYNWNENIVLRPYQNDAVTSVLNSEGSGILKLSIRSGKTIIAARIIYEMGLKTLFLVPSSLLLSQTIEAFGNVLLEEIGEIGGGIWNEQNVTVATFPSLITARARKDDKYLTILDRYDVVIADECHSMVDNTWVKVMLELDCYCKIGLSATVYLDSDKEKQRGIIYLRSACGGIKYELSPSELIALGHLLPPDIRLYPIRTPDLTGQAWSHELQLAGIYENEYRNKKICEIANELANDGYHVLIVTNRTSQIEALEGLFDELSIKPYVVIGDTKKTDRKTILDDFLSNTGTILISTVISEGVDIPECEVVINGDGGSDVKSCVQKMRCLTPAKDKTKAIYVDFLDFTNKYFTKHSKNRLDVYRSEPLFNIRVIV